MEKGQVGYDCSCCPYFHELPVRELENDFGYCVKKDCEVYYHVLFEHYRCKEAINTWGI